MKWENLIIGMQHNTIYDEIKWLDEMGSREWELVQFVEPQDHYYFKENYYYFKRRIAINEKLRKSQQLKEVPNDDEENDSS